MSTKLRVVIQKDRNRPIFGRRAIAYLRSIVSAKVMRLVFPPGYERYTRQQRLEWLARYLPPDTQMFLIRERRNTRRNRSVYVKMSGGERRYRLPQQQPPVPLRFQRQIQEHMEQMQPTVINGNR